MNGLAYSNDGILVSEQFLAQNRLNVGDSVDLSINLEGGLVGFESVIVGSFKIFPIRIDTTGARIGSRKLCSARREV